MGMGCGIQIAQTWSRGVGAAASTLSVGGRREETSGAMLVTAVLMTSQGSGRVNCSCGVRPSDPPKFDDFVVCTHMAEARNPKS